MDRIARDFRSDTVTQPSTAMKAAMIEAPLGDDVFGEDPTANKLQAEIARLTGFEDALLVPTGSMGNLTALMNHAQPGSILYSGRTSHIKLYELSSYSRIAGLNLFEIDDSGGRLDLEQLRRSWSPEVYYMPVPGLIAVENTHNMLGGLIYPEPDLAELSAFARERGVPVHMDGARLWHAARAQNKPLTHWTRHVNSVMLCFSKGLGTPVGSILAGSREFIAKARVTRKLLGGGMRQCGILAAAALYALEHHFPALDETHRLCRQVAQALSELDWLTVTPPQTNILIARLQQPKAAELVAAVAEKHDYRFLAIAEDAVRICFHQHNDDAACDGLVAAIEAWGQT
ncbi:MAG: GntG family PLP-dependent aldolase [Acidobacteriota bacterium]|nr:GntG family PLP-dependent aldolase [Acidobacteriota bacterium]